MIAERFGVDKKKYKESLMPKDQPREIVPGMKRSNS